MTKVNPVVDFGTEIVFDRINVQTITSLVKKLRETQFLMQFQKQCQNSLRGQPGSKLRNPRKDRPLAMKGWNN